MKKIYSVYHYASGEIIVTCDGVRFLVMALPGGEPVAKDFVDALANAHLVANALNYYQGGQKE